MWMRIRVRMRRMMRMMTIMIMVMMKTGSQCKLANMIMSAIWLSCISPLWYDGGV